jgi:GTP-binding protein
MSFTDEYRFKAEAGKGGDGVVRWRREKFKPWGGPNGGNGGKGGDLVVEAVRDIMMLNRISHKDHYHAQDGEPGGSNSMTGADGDDLTVLLPIGSVVTNKVTGAVFELLHEGERVTILKGGVGGKGNEHFKSSTNVAPDEATLGTDGEAANFTVELRLIADIGLVGLPNAGKTSLLNALTNAGAKVADYPFTTLDPNLGVYHNYIIAVIPGLIEGASEGKGLGDKFLRHISRTTFILHCISVERDTMLNDYNTIRRELESHPEILNKDEYIVCTKSDTLDKDTLEERIASFARESNVPILATVTVLDDNSIKDFGDTLSRALAARKMSIESGV